MSMTRRAVLTAGAAVAAVTATGGLAEPAAAVGLPLRRSTFSRLLGRRLVAASSHRRVRVRLAAIRDVLGTRPGSQDSFVLELASRHHLPDGLYVLSHPGSGSHKVFMSAVGQGRHRRYEVVVNRAHPRHRAR